MTTNTSKLKIETHLKMEYIEQDKIKEDNNYQIKDKSLKFIKKCYKKDYLFYPKTFERYLRSGILEDLTNEKSITERTNSKLNNKIQWIL